MYSRPGLPKRAYDSDKYGSGSVLVIAGSERYPGAAVLAARAAQRAGAGYVTLVVPGERVQLIAQTHLLSAPVIAAPVDQGAFSADAAEVIGSIASRFDSIVIGPGMTVAPGVATLVGMITTMQGAPLVIDADAINALANDPTPLLQRTAPAVITPHAREARRLADAMGILPETDAVSSYRALAGPARIAVLKGADTSVCSESDEAVCTLGTPALATAGTGDVLSGVVGAFLAQGLDSFSAARLGVEIHAIAGRVAERRLNTLSVTAEDVLEALGEAVSEYSDR